MAAELTTQTKELGDSRVRVDVEVSPQEIEREVERAARALGGEMKVPGFREGKVPAPVVIQRIGREAVLDEAVRQALPGWYESAVHEAGIVTVGDPKVDFSDLPEKGRPLEFSIEVGVRPVAKLGEYKGLDVPRREPQPSDEEIEAELARLRESAATLETVDREAGEGDFVVMDFIGRIDGEPFEGGEARGQLLELGSGRFIEGFEDGLRGARAGETREVKTRFPDEYHAEHLAGKEAVFEVAVKEVKQKHVPELDDEFAESTGGFDSLAELREDIRTRLAEAQARQVETEFREAVVDAAVARAEIDLPKELVHAKAHEMWHHTERRMRAQGIDPQRYLEVMGKTAHELIDEAEPEAERALRRESVLAAVVDAEGIEVSDDELLASLREAATAGGGKPPSERKLRDSLNRAKSEGRADMLREDIAMRKAVDLMVEQATPVDPGTAEAREKLWTPEGAAAQSGGGEIWTPGSER